MDAWRVTIHKSMLPAHVEDGSYTLLDPTKDLVDLFSICRFPLVGISVLYRAR
jgi:hypothetical protein